MFLGRRVISDRRIASPLAVLVVALLCVFAYATDALADGENAKLEVEVTLGFNGRFKQGTWIPVHIEVTNVSTAEFKGYLVIESPDGEGIVVRFVDRHLQITVPPTTAVTRTCLLYTSPSPRDQRGSRMPSSA